MRARYFILGLVMATGLCIGCGKDENESPTAPPVPAAPEYSFRGPMSRDVLVSYLSRAMTMSELCLGYEWSAVSWEANLRLIADLEPKFLGRVAYMWGWEHEYLSDLERLPQRTAAIHAIDPDIILQACIFECVSKYVERVPVPVHVQTAFGLDPVPRSFDLDAMKPLLREPRVYGGQPVEAIVPDVTRRETRMWFYHLATLYIDAGIEAFHLGRLEAVAEHDRDRTVTAGLLDRIRTYARDHARRGWVLMDAHTHGLKHGKRLLLDFHSWPLRPRESVGTGAEDAVLDPDFLDAIFGRSRGGITPSGWYAQNLPFLVEFDNGYGGPVPGGCDLPECVWGCDEITWFARQSPERRDAILEQFHREVRRLDPNGFLQMPGMRTLQMRAGPGSHFYFVHDPDLFNFGFGQEDVIHRLWTDTADQI